MKKVYGAEVCYRGECRRSGSSCKEGTAIQLSVNKEMRRGVLTVHNASTKAYETVFMTEAQMDNLAYALGRAKAKLSQG